MSTRTEYICDRCGKSIKTTHAGGKTHNFEPAVYLHPPVHFRVTDNRNDTYDFCSPECLELWSAS